MLDLLHKSSSNSAPALLLYTLVKEVTHATNTSESNMATTQQTKKTCLDAELEPEIPHTVEEPEGSIFFRLPRELRDEVYKHLLLDGGSVDVMSSRAAVPAIGHACRQLRHETAQVFYRSQFTFRMHMNDYTPVTKWNDALRAYFDLTLTELTPVAVFWAPCPTGSEDVASANLLRYLQRVFAKKVGLNEGGAWASTKEQRKLFDPLKRKRVELVLMVEALRDQGLKWDDVKVAIGHAIDAAMICGEL